MVSKIKIIAIGKIKEKYLLEGMREYEKRLRPFCKLEIIELKNEGLAKEADKLAKYLAKNTYALDVHGQQFSSEAFAEFLKQDQDISFIIGGSDGIDTSLKSKVKLISLSNMTFLHEMTRLLLLEQIYRGYMIAHHRTYHK